MWEDRYAAAGGYLFGTEPARFLTENPWLVLPGGNLGNSSAIAKGLIELRDMGLIDRLPRLAVARPDDRVAPPVLSAPLGERERESPVERATDRDPVEDEVADRAADPAEEAGLVVSWARAGEAHLAGRRHRLTHRVAPPSSRPRRTARGTEGKPAD